MKKILTLLCCIVAVCATGQTTIPNSRYAYKTLADALATIKANGLKVTISDPFVGGNFIFHDTTEGFKADEGINITIPGTSQIMARDISQTGGKVDVRWWGAKPNDSTFNSTTAFDLASKYCVSKGGGTIMVDGKYWVDSILLRSKVCYEGSSMSGAVIIARSRTVTGRSYGLLILNKGAVINANIRNIQLWANNRVGGSDTAINHGQWAGYFPAQFDDANTQGGYWNSTWDNVYALGFDSGFWFRAGYSRHHHLLPIQHLQFKKIDVEVRGGVGIRHTGQQGQIEYDGGKVRGINNLIGNRAIIDIQIDYDPNPAEIAKEGVHGETKSDTAGIGKANSIPGNLTFMNGFNAANSETGYYISGGAQHNIRNGWIENAAIAIHLSGKPRVLIEGERVSNGANGSQFITDTIGDGDAGEVGDTVNTLLGTVFQWDAIGANVTWGANNYLAGRVDKFLTLGTGVKLSKMGTLSYLTPLDRTATDSSFYPKTGVVQLALDSTRKIGISAFNNFYLSVQPSNPTGFLDSITSQLAPDAFLSITVLNSNVTVTNNGNILTPSKRPITFSANSTFMLQRVIGSVEQWRLILPVNIVTSVPADSGYFTTGTILWNRISGVAQAIGWYCQSGGYAVSDSVYNATGTTPRAIFIPISGTTNGLLNPSITHTVFNSTNPNLSLGYSTNSALGTIQLTIPDADTLQDGFVNRVAQFWSGTKVFMAAPQLRGLVNGTSTDSIVTVRPVANSNVLARAALKSNLPAILMGAAGSYTFSIDTGRATTQAATGYDLNKVRDSLQANISAASSVRAIPYFITPGNGSLAANTSSYAMVGNGALDADSLKRNNTFPVPGTIGNLVVVTGGAQDASGSLTLTFKSGSTAIGATNSTVVATVAASAGSGKYTDLTHTLHVASLDQVFIAIKNNAAATSAIIRSIAFTFTPD